MSKSEALAAAVEPVTATITATIDGTYTLPSAPTWFAINRKPDSEDDAEISIYDAIGAYGITADSFVNALRGIRAKRINVRLNTPGGEIFDGTAIYNALKAHPAHVTVYVDGVAASAGSFIAMSGDEVRMADNAYMMIHNARGGVMGEAGDMRRYADLLEKCNDNIAGMYEKKTGKKREHWRGLMDAETWFTAEEAKAEGLADEVYAAAKKTATTKAAFDYTIYNKIPDPVRRMWGLTDSPSPAATLSSAAAPAPTQETTAMADTSTANTAQESAAVASGPTTQTKETKPMNDPVPAPSTDSLAGLQQITAQNYIDRGVANGRFLERQAQHELMRNIVAACPGRPDMAIQAFLTNQSPDSVKLAFDAAEQEKRNADNRIAAMELDTARRIALASAGGYNGGVASGMSKSEDDALVIPPDTDPQVQAQMEWTGNYKNCQSKSTEKQYLLARVQQLKGNVRALVRN